MQQNLILKGKISIFNISETGFYSQLVFSRRYNDIRSLDVCNLGSINCL